MIKLLFVIHDLRKGGGETSLLNLVSNLDSTKFKSTIMLDYYRGELIDQVPSNVKVIYKNKKEYKGFPRKWNLVKNLFFDKYPNLLHRESYDIEIAFTHGKITTLNNSKNPSTKKIAWLHMDVSYFREEELKDLKILFNKVDELVCVSKAVGENLKKTFPNLKPKVEVVYNFQENEKIQKLAEEKIEVFKKSKLTLLTLTRFHRHKGVDRAIRAHAKLLSLGYDNELVIVGSGDADYRAKMIELIACLKVEKTVQLLGMKTNPYPYLKACDLFLMPSRSESFSLTTLEALSLSKPIVATKNPGPDEVLGFGKYGLIVPNTEDSLTDGILKMIENTELKKEFIDRSIQGASRFDIAVILPKIEHYLQSLVK